MKKKVRNILSLVFNLATIVLVTYSVTVFCFGGGVGNMSGSGFYAFIYYTTDSNVLAAILCLPMLVCNIRALFGRDDIPLWVNICKWVAVTCIMLTFMVVMCFLGVLMGYRAMLAGFNLYLHMVCPLLCLVSFLFFERGPLPKRYLPWTILPTVLYGIVYFVQVVLRDPLHGGWIDFYMFNRDGNWPITVVVILISTLLISTVVRAIRRKIASE